LNGLKRIILAGQLDFDSYGDELAQTSLLRNGRQIFVSAFAKTGANSTVFFINNHFAVISLWSSDQKSV